MLQANHELMRSWLFTERHLLYFPARYVTKSESIVGFMNTQEIIKSQRKSLTMLPWPHQLGLVWNGDNSVNRMGTLEGKHIKTTTQTAGPLNHCLASVCCLCAKWVTGLRYLKDCFIFHRHCTGWGGWDAGGSSCVWYSYKHKSRIFLGIWKPNIL